MPLLMCVSTCTLGSSSEVQAQQTSVMMMMIILHLFQPHQADQMSDPDRILRMQALTNLATPIKLCWVQDIDEFWMYDELKTRVVDPHALRNKYTNGTPTVKDKDSDKMIASRSAHVSATSGLPPYSASATLENVVCYCATPGSRLTTTRTDCNCASTLTGSYFEGCKASI